MDINNYKRLEIFGSQFSEAFPLQVPKRLKQTFPHEYRLGLNLTSPFPVVYKLHFGGD